MNGEQTLNYKAECLKTAQDFFTETVYDVCKGTNITIPQGELSTVFNMLGIAVFSAIAVLVLVVSFKIFFD